MAGVYRMRTIFEDEENSYASSSTSSIVTCTEINEMREKNVLVTGRDPTNYVDASSCTTDVQSVRFNRRLFDVIKKHKVCAIIIIAAFALLLTCVPKESRDCHYSSNNRIEKMETEYASLIRNQHVVDVAVHDCCVPITIGNETITPDNKEEYFRLTFEELLKNNVIAFVLHLSVPCDILFTEVNAMLSLKINVLTEVINKYFSNSMKICWSASDVSTDKTCVFIAIPMHGFPNFKTFETFITTFNKVKVISIATYCTSKWAESATTEKKMSPMHKYGLTKLRGFSLITKINQAGLILDMSGSSQRTILKTLEKSSAPVLFSRSGVGQFCTSLFNLRNETIQYVENMSQNKPVVAVAVSSQLTCEKSVTVSDIYRHVKYLGIENVAISSNINNVTRAEANNIKYPDMLKLIYNKYKMNTTMFMSKNFMELMNNVELGQIETKGKSSYSDEDIRKIETQ